MKLIDYTLRYPIEFEGKTYKEISVRRPTVGDQNKLNMWAKKRFGDEDWGLEETIQGYLHILADIPEQVVEMLALEDYTPLGKPLTKVLISLLEIPELSPFSSPKRQERPSRKSKNGHRKN